MGSGKEIINLLPASHFWYLFVKDYQVFQLTQGRLNAPQIGAGYVGGQCYRKGTYVKGNDHISDSFQAAPGIGYGFLNARRHGNGVRISRSGAACKQILRSIEQTALIRIKVQLLLMRKLNPMSNLIFIQRTSHTVVAFGDTVKLVWRKIFHIQIQF